jgi:hypothetical protein
VPTNSPTAVVTNSPTLAVTPTATPPGQTPTPPYPVGGLVDVQTTGGGSSAGGLSVIGIFGVLAVLVTLGLAGAYSFARRRND